MDLTFFEISAQVIPALLIALVIESAFLRPRPENAPRFAAPSQVRELIQIGAVLAPFIYGEWVALRGLRNSAAGPGDASTVTAALIACGAFIVTPVRMSHARRLGKFAEELVGWTISAAALAALIVVLIA